jgi:hypothetical protein
MSVDYRRNLMRKIIIGIVFALPIPLCAAANAVLEGYRAGALQESAGFKDFSAARGPR